jgi:glycerophosphoryl diester phosphodiesterase
MPSKATRDVQVVAHRGSSGVRAEHTLGAYEQALKDGADAVECDVRLTRDGVLVCVHDRRVDRTSDGTGVVSTLEYRELAELDFASWKARRSDPLLEAAWEEADTDPERGRVLTFERLLQLVLDEPSGRRVQLQVETKHPTRYGGLVERRLVELLTRYGLHAPLSRSVSPVAVLSYAPTSLRRVHALAPLLPTVLNMDRVPVRYRDGSLPAQVGAAGIALSTVQAHPRIVGRFQGRGHRVHVFTADDPEDIDLLLELGVDAIISNHPRRVLRRLGRV